MEARAHTRERKPLIVAPVIVDDHGAVDFFASVEDAERYLEPWAAEQRLTAYDSEGRLLEIGVERGESSFFFGLSKGMVDYVVLVAVEDEPDHAPQLRATILSLLERTGCSPANSGKLPLRELVRRGVQHVGFTR